MFEDIYVVYETIKFYDVPCVSVKHTFREDKFEDVLEFLQIYIGREQSCYNFILDTLIFSSKYNYDYPFVQSISGNTYEELIQKIKTAFFDRGAYRVTICLFREEDGEEVFLTLEKITMKWKD